MSMSSSRHSAPPWTPNTTPAASPTPSTKAPSDESFGTRMARLGDEALMRNVKAGRQFPPGKMADKE